MRLLALLTLMASTLRDVVARKGEELCVECGQHPRAGSDRLSPCWACIKATVQRDLEARERRRVNTSKGGSS